MAWIRSKCECPAIRRLLPNTEHRRQKRLNNQAENSHRPVRKRERVMQRSKSPEQAQQFLETSSAVCNHFRARSHRLPPDHAQAFPAVAGDRTCGTGSLRDGRESSNNASSGSSYDRSRQTTCQCHPASDYSGGGGFEASGRKTHAGLARYVLVVFTSITAYMA